MVSDIEAGEPAASVVEALSDDLNTAGAIAALHDLSRAGDAAGLKASARLLGLLEDRLGAWAITITDFSPFVARLASLRAEAMTTKNFAPVDALKSALTEAGVEVRMSKAGVELLPGPGFDPAKLESLK
jgi:cysteinyl-tRNA synthetase